MSWSRDFFTKKQTQVHNKTSAEVKNLKINKIVLTILSKFFQKS